MLRAHKHACGAHNGVGSPRSQGAEAPAFSAQCARHSGRDVEICGWLYRASERGGPFMLVSAPDATAAAVLLPGFRPPKHWFGPITLRGRLSYGLAVRGGVASYLRLERARVVTVYSP